MTRTATALIALLTAALTTGPAALAHDGHDHKVMGTITMAAADHVMVKTTDGKDVTILVTDTTKVSKGKEAIRAEDIKVGTRVVVTAISEKDVMKAKQIQVGVAAKPAAKTAAKSAAK